MNPKEVFFHNFNTNYIEEDPNDRVTVRFKSILKHGLVSYNYYNSIVNKDSTEIYRQRTHPSVYGYSKDCISLIDPQKKFTGNVGINCFLEPLCCYVLLKRDSIERNLDTTEYKLYGEVKVKNNIPIDDFKGFAFGKLILRHSIFIPLIKEGLERHNLKHLTLYEVSSEKTKDDIGFETNLFLKEISVR